MIFGVENGCSTIEGWEIEAAFKFVKMYRNGSRAFVVSVGVFFDVDAGSGVGCIFPLVASGCTNCLALSASPKIGAFFLNPVAFGDALLPASLPTKSELLVYWIFRLLHISLFLIIALLLNVSVWSEKEIILKFYLLKSGLPEVRWKFFETFQTHSGI